MGLIGTIWSRVQGGAVEAPEILEDDSDKDEMVDLDEDISDELQLAIKVGCDNMSLWPRSKVTDPWSSPLCA